MDVLNNYKKQPLKFTGSDLMQKFLFFEFVKNNFSLQGQGQCIRMSEMTWFS